jgi:hypothetical protein
MKKGKRLTVLVLVLEIAFIAILHAVKITQSEKAATKEMSRNSSAENLETHQKAPFTLAKY